MTPGSRGQAWLARPANQPSYVCLIKYWDSVHHLWGTRVGRQPLCCWTGIWAGWGGHKERESRAASRAAGAVLLTLFAFEKSQPWGMNSSNHGVYRASFCPRPCHLTALEVWRELPNEFQVLGKVSLPVGASFFSFLLRQEGKLVKLWKPPAALRRMTSPFPTGVVDLGHGRGCGSEVFMQGRLLEGRSKTCSLWTFLWKPVPLRARELASCSQWAAAEGSRTG